MRLFVTGRLGYVGPTLVSRLKHAGRQVTGYDIGSCRDCLSEADRLVFPDAEIIKDIRPVWASDLDGRSLLYQ